MCAAQLDESVLPSASGATPGCFLSLCLEHCSPALLRLPAAALGRFLVILPSFHLLEESGSEAHAFESLQEALTVLLCGAIDANHGSELLGLWEEGKGKAPRTGHPELSNCWAGTRFPTSCTAVGLKQGVDFGRLTWLRQAARREPTGASRCPSRLHGESSSGAPDVDRPSVDRRSVRILDLAASWASISVEGWNGIGASVPRGGMPTEVPWRTILRKPTRAIAVTPLC